MTSATDHGTHPGRLDSPDVRPLAVFAAGAVPIGWVFLSGYQLLDLPPEPFVLLTLLIGLVLPAAVLVRRDPGASGRDLLRDCRRPSRPALLLVPALVAIPGTTAAVAALAGVSEDLDADLAVGLAVNVVSSVSSSTCARSWRGPGSSSAVRCRAGDSPVAASWRRTS